MPGPTLQQIDAAAARIAGHAHRTPVVTCRAIDAVCAAEIFFKCENLQKVGAFKFRGAANVVLSLTDAEARHGVATHSSGNHAQALALAARLRSVPAYVVMPETAPRVKRVAVEGYGAQIITCRPNLAAREEGLAEVVARTRAHVVHPYDDHRIIAGQGTAARELLADVADLDTVMTPVGGGGLLSGTAVAVTESAPGVQVVGAEPAGADDAYRSLQAGRILPSENPQTICDGLLTSLGERTFPIIRDRVARIVTVSDAAVLRALRLIWERAKLIVEPSAVVGLAALLEKRDEVPGRRIGIVLSGGNIDLDRLPWVDA